MDILPILTIIQSTHASLEGFQQSGLLDRHRRLLAEYSTAFHVVLYTSDSVDYSGYLGVEHRPVPLLPENFGWRHLAFYLWLVWKAPRMKGVIKVFGSNIPTLPLVKLLSRRPMIVTYQWDYAAQTQANEKSNIKYWLAPALEKLAIIPADLVLVTAKWLEEKIHNTYSKKTILLPNWVDLGSAFSDCKEVVRNDRLILYTGRLHWSKGVNILINAFARVKLRHSDARLVICGTGEEEEKLRAQVKSLGVADVEFMGRVSNADVLKLMQSAAIFVLPTLTMEGHPKALIEAMACGAACIATDVPGNRELIAAGQNGYLTHPNDPDQLAQTICLLLQSDEKRSALALQGRETTSQFDFGVVTGQELEALLSLVNSSGGDGSRRAGSCLNARDGGGMAIHAIYKLLLRTIITTADILLKVVDRIAIEAESGVHPKHRLMDYHRFFLDRLSPQDIVIDFGCGRGSVAYDIAAKCKRVIGVDIDEASIRFAKRRYIRDNLSFEDADATSWQFPQDTTVTVLSNVLEHLRDRPRLLRTIRTQCNRLLIRVPAFDRDWLVPFKRQLGLEWRSDRTHEIEYTAETLTREIEEAGLTIVHMERRWGEFYLECS